MRHPSADLAILSAESYDHGVRQLRSRKPQTTTMADTVTQDSEGGPARKRRKDASPNAEGEDEAKKRSRGRPRLEPKDETAQDRRRTQIRLAQRAYRNRKENAIQTLERQVQGLKDANEEMNNAFLKLHDFAVGQGLLDLMPDVGRKLRETTQKFLSLARKSANDEYEDDGDAPDPNPDDRSASRESDSVTPRNSDPSLESYPTKSAEQSTEQRRTQLPQKQVQVYGGFVVTQEPSSPNKHSSIVNIPDHTPTPDYEVITYPTLDNASFPFGFTPDLYFSTPELLAPINGADFSSFAPSPYASLPPPPSFAAQEATFGRRFHRRALERAWTLVTMPHPPPKQFARIFGFCLLFEPLESIRTRLQRGLDRAASESLHYWRYPFHQLGAAGTHFDTTTPATTTAGPSQPRFGNQGTADIHRPRTANGFGMGPFDARVNAARDVLDAGHYLPFSKSEFYDSDEMEMYLHQRGVYIPPAADVVTVEIDERAFTEVDDDDDGGGGAGAGGGERGPAVTADGGANSVGSTTINPLDTLSRYDSAGSGLSGARSASAATRSQGESSGAGTAVTMPGDFAHSSLWGFDGSGALLGAGAATGKKQVTVDVNRFIFEMVERATCLGRSPGLRRQDINGAFWSAVRQSS